MPWSVAGSTGPDRDESLNKYHNITINPRHPIGVNDQ